MAYDKNTDYQAMINDAVAKGDYTSAAVFEQQRNEKIKGEGITDYQTTNNYSQYLNGGVSQAQNPENDYSDYLKELYAQQMEAELSALKSQYDKNAAGLKADAEKKSGRHVSPVPRSSAEMPESHRDAPLSARRSLHESLLPDRSSPVSIP